MPDYYTKPTLSYLILAVFLGVGLNRALSFDKARLIAISLISVSIILQALVLPAYSGFTRKNTDILDLCKETLAILPENAVVFADWNHFTSLLCVQEILKIRPDIAIYEASLHNQPRHYKIGDSIKTFSWHQYIDDNIKNKERPIFTLVVDEYLESKYKIVQKSSNIYLISPKGS